LFTTGLMGIPGLWIFPRAQLKIHKPGIPIRPVVNNRTASSYKAAKADMQHTIDNIMTLIKPLHSQHLLTAYKQFYIHSFHKNGKLISEQSPGSPNPLFDLTIHQFEPRANRASCATNSSVYTLPANWF